MISINESKAQIEFIEVNDGQPFTIGNAQISGHRLNHPSITVGYRIEYGNKTLSYISDVDLYNPTLLGEDMKNGSPEEELTWHQQLQNNACDLAHRANLMICDTFFLPEDCQHDWGHSRPEDALRLGDEAAIECLVLFHHEPHRNDSEIDAVQEQYRKEASFDLFASAQGLKLSL